MVFSALPVYLDPPNWQQQHNDQQGTGSENHPQLLPPHPPPPPPPPPTHGGGSVRPGSIADRARLANIPPPETALKCPRCESTNTKFCYFNNYSLSQPRHFCKACRRYWTRGGNLRNVPVGGGCRRNKKNKSNGSKSSTSTEKQVDVTVTQSDQSTYHFPQQSPHLPIMASLQNLSQYGLGNIGLNFGGIHGQIGATGGSSGHTDMEFQQQLSFFEQRNGNLYPFQSEGIDASSSSRVSQLAPLMKTENNQRLNLSRTQLGVAENNQYWGGNSTWTDLSGLNSSTANHLL